MWKYIITHFRWDDYIQNIVCRDPNVLDEFWNPTPIDLTWSTIKFSIKKNETDTDYIYTWTATIINAVWGIVQVSISHTVTTLWQPQSCYYDIQITYSNWEVKTIVKDSFIISYDITR
jgi:hypothetical protein